MSTGNNQEKKINWNPRKLKSAAQQLRPRPPRMSVAQAELYRCSWKSLAEDKICQLAPRDFKSQSVGAWPVSLVIAKYPKDNFWTDPEHKDVFINECLAKADELYS
jgi:hypothetical protein